MKHYLALLCLVILFGCNNRPVPKADNVDTRKDLSDSIFKVKTIQDSLSLFVSKIDSFPNPYGPTIYNICISKITNDTIIHFIAYGTALTASPQYQEVFFPVGSMKVNDKIYTLSYLGTKEMGDIVNEQLFNLDYYKYLYLDKLPYTWDVVPSLRRYRLSGTDSLTLEYHIKSKYEK